MKTVPTLYERAYGRRGTPSVTPPGVFYETTKAVTRPRNPFRPSGETVPVTNPSPIPSQDAQQAALQAQHLAEQNARVAAQQETIFRLRVALGLGALVVAGGAGYEVYKRNKKEEE